MQIFASLFRIFMLELCFQAFNSLSFQFHLLFTFLCSLSVIITIAIEFLSILSVFAMILRCFFTIYLTCLVFSDCFDIIVAYQYNTNKITSSFIPPILDYIVFSSNFITLTSILAVYQSKFPFMQSSIRFYSPYFLCIDLMKSFAPLFSYVCPHFPSTILQFVLSQLYLGRFLNELLVGY